MSGIFTAKLSCACGATAEFEAPGYYMIKRDGRGDYRYIVQDEMQDWKHEHSSHAELVHNQGREMPL